MRRKQKAPPQKFRDITLCGIDEDVLQRLTELEGRQVSEALFLLANHQAAIVAEVRRLRDVVQP